MLKLHLPQGVTLFHGDCRNALRSLPDNSIDAVPCDPPYELNFMGKGWDDTGIANDPALWAEVYRVLKPGGHLAAFSASRTYHRMACAIEDAGFEIRDSLMWIYGTGFPKSQDVSKFIDRELGAEREKVKPRSVIGHQRNIGNVRPYMLDPDHMTDSDEPASEQARAYQGFGTALKPAVEPIVLARKPLSEPTVAANVLKWRTGALNIDGCRVATADGEHLGGGRLKGATPLNEGWDRPWMHDETRRESDAAIMTAKVAKAESLGRWPANVVTDGSDEVVGMFPTAGGQQGAISGREPSHASDGTITGKRRRVPFPKREAGSHWNIGGERSSIPGGATYCDNGSAARFFYSAKASKADRNGSKHPTVKPISLIQWLARLITPPGGTILDPFAGSGTTGAAGVAEGFSVILCEQESEYVADIRRRLGGSRLLVPLDAVRAELALAPQIAALRERLTARA